MSTNLAPRKSRKAKTINDFFNMILDSVRAGEKKAEEDFYRIVVRAKQEMQDAENFFDNVSDPELVDHAIYKMEAAKSQYVYLLKQAKAKGFKAVENVIFK